MAEPSGTAKRIPLKASIGSGDPHKKEAGRTRPLLLRMM